MQEEIKVLDHGFVRLVDSMGDDSSIVQAARVSYGSGIKTVSKDRALIRYLVRNKHTSPLEMVEFKFHCKMPIFVARQWVRHRTASINEYSGRYSIMKEEFYTPEQFNIQSRNNKQGSSEESIEDAEISYNVRCLKSFQQYQKMLDKSISREQARIVLPLSAYTEWYWKIDLHNLFNFLRLRLDNHAQYEIRMYAEAIAKIVKDVCPIVYEAFEDYILNAITFSKQELEIIGSYLEQPLKEYPLNENPFSGTENLSKRELTEFHKKLDIINNLGQE